MKKPDYPWINEKGHVDIKKLPYPVEIEGHGYYKNFDAAEFYFGWPAPHQRRFREAIKRSSRTCPECGDKYIDLVCMKCKKKADDIAYKKQRKNEIMKKQRDEFAKVLGKIKYPFKPFGFTFNNREQVIAQWTQAGTQRKPIETRRNLINNLRDALGEV